MKEIQESAGLQEPNQQFLDLLNRDDFNDEEYDKVMAQAFNDEYYEVSFCLNKHSVTCPSFRFQSLRWTNQLSFLEMN